MNQITATTITRLNKPKNSSLDSCMLSSPNDESEHLTTPQLPFQSVSRAVAGSGGGSQGRYCGSVERGRSQAAMRKWHRPLSVAPLVARLSGVGYSQVLRNSTHPARCRHRPPMRPRLPTRHKLSTPRPRPPLCRFRFAPARAVPPRRRSDLGLLQR